MFMEISAQLCDVSVKIMGILHRQENELKIKILATLLFMQVQIIQRNVQYTPNHITLFSNCLLKPRLLTIT